MSSAGRAGPTLVFAVMGVVLACASRLPPDGGSPKQPAPAARLEGRWKPAPRCRLDGGFATRIRGLTVQAVKMLAKRPGIDLRFASQISVNPETTPKSGLWVDIVADADRGSVDPGGCITSSDKRTGVADAHTVTGVCSSRRPGPGLAHMGCSAGAIAAVARASRIDDLDLVLLHLIAHEVSHLGRGHVEAAFMDGFAGVPLDAPPRARLMDIVTRCDVPGAVGLNNLSPRLEEVQADSDADWIVRIELDDMSAEGAGRLIPPERGGLGEIPVEFIGEDGRVLPRPGRGQRGSPSARIAQFRQASENLHEWQRQLVSLATVPDALKDDGAKQISMLDIDQRARDLVCRVVAEPITAGSLALPALPGLRHPDGARRFYELCNRIEAISSDAASVETVMDRQLAEARDRLAEPFCFYARQVETTLAAGTVGNCATTLAAALWPGICSPARTSLAPPENHPLESSSLLVKADAGELEVPGHVGDVVPLDQDRLLVSTVRQADSYVGVTVKGSDKLSLAKIPCTATRLLAAGLAAVALCEEPPAIVRIDLRKQQAHVRRLFDVYFNDLPVDGFIEGLLDGNGKPVTQTMKRPGQVSRHGVYLMNTAKFTWAGWLTGHPVFSFEMGEGRSELVPTHGPLGTTWMLNGDAVVALPEATRAPSCDSVQEPLQAYRASDDSLVAIVRQSPIRLVTIAPGSQAVRRWVPRRGPGGELDDQDLVACTWERESNAIICLRESGEVLEVGLDGARRSRGTFSIAGRAGPDDLCSAHGKLYGAFLVGQSGLQALRVASLDRSGQRREFATIEDVEAHGLRCNEHGAVAWVRRITNSAVVRLD